MKLNKYLKSLQIENETKLNKFNKKKFIKELLLEVYKKPDNLDVEDYLEVVEALVPLIDKRKMLVASFIGLMRPRYDKVEEVLNLLNYLVVNYLITVRGGVITPSFQLEGEELEHYQMFQYPLPMLCEPADAYESDGFYTGKRSLILNSDYSNNEEFNPDFLNILNKNQYYVSREMVNYINHDTLKWKSEDNPLTEENKTIFLNNFRAVMSNLLITGYTLYISWKYDHRGRAYPCGYYLNLQGNDALKSVVEFAHKEQIEG